MEPPAGGQQLCVLLVSDRGQEEVRKREVGCQWESPEEQRREEQRREEQRREVGCQSDSAERRDAGVQVDLLTQQLSWRHSGPSAMLLQCFAVRPDGPDGGALLQHCTTRTRTIRPAVKPSTKPAQTRSRTQRRPAPHSSNTAKRKLPRRHRHHLESPDTDLHQEEEEEEAEEEEEEEEVEEEEVEEEENTQDPTWTPPEADAECPSALGDVRLDSDSQHARLRAVKLEPDSTVCDVCGKVMKNKSSLARHSFIHTGKKPFGCHLCELRFNRRDNLQHHLSRLHPDGVAKPTKRRPAAAWLCAVCGKTFSCRSRLKTHEVIHSGVKPHRCDLCPKAYMRTNDLEHHRRSVHADGAADPPRPSSLLCDFCGKEFKCRSQLSVHYQIHTGERPHLCDICGRKFGRRYQLKRHEALVHAGRADGEENRPPDAPFSCGVCGKRLKSEALLAAHGRVHTGDKPHRCAVCLRGFRRAACLKQHHVRVHLKVRAGAAPHAVRRKSRATGKEFPCSVCSKVFRFRSLLSSHSLVHSELRPFACDFCGRSFRRLGHLKRHRQVVHADGARPPQTFVCHICGKDKKCRSQLARHVIIHTGERPFGCDLCSARFNRRGNLQQHRKRMHAVGTPPEDEVPPILFDDDAATYKQEETVVAVDEQLEDDDVRTPDAT